MERVPNELLFDFPSGSRKPMCGGLEYSGDHMGDHIYHPLSVFTSAERKS